MPSVLKLDYVLGPAVAEEMDFFSKTDEGKKTYSKLRTQADVERHVDASGEYRDLKQIVERFPKGRLLDVGVGYGITSAYFAIQGFDVTAVEPSTRLCDDMAVFFQELGLSVRTVNGLAESIYQLDGAYDVIVFNSSVHHCDDMDNALVLARRKLRPGGAVCLVNEPVLKFYRTKEWFYKTLKENPEKVGHYGGNEHIYRHSEYVESMRKSGLKDVTSLPSLNYFYVPKRAPWDNGPRFIAKQIYYFLVQSILLKSAGLRKILNHLSLLNNVIVARNPERELN